MSNISNGRRTTIDLVNIYSISIRSKERRIYTQTLFTFTDRLEPGNEDKKILTGT